LYSRAVQRKVLFLATVVFLSVVADQVTKYLVVRDLTTLFDDKPTFGARLGALYGEAPAPTGRYHFPRKRFITVSENFFHIRYEENPGAAFGLFRDYAPRTRALLFHGVSLAAVVLIVFSFIKLRGDRSEVWARWGLPLVLGGALGNWIDRLARGFVIDFLEAHWYDRFVWPSFNIADMAITIGVAMLILDALVRREVKVPEAPPGNPQRG
jgi:signal peptidase II